MPQEQKSQLLDQFIGMRLAADAAEKSGVTKDQKVEDQLALARLNVIVDAGLQKYLEAHPVTDEELKPEYDAQVAAMPREYHARHILVDDKAAADAITKDLKGGADFAKLAEKKSKDSSGKSGGDLGWFTLDTMVKPFGEAVAKLQPGQLTDEPVQSQFGWHVIKLEESRASTPPAVRRSEGSREGAGSAQEAADLPRRSAEEREGGEEDLTEAADGRQATGDRQKRVSCSVLAGSL